MEFYALAVAVLSAVVAVLSVVAHRTRTRLDDRILAFLRDEVLPRLPPPSGKP